MKITNYVANVTYPTVDIAVNKSRLKRYQKQSNQPIYYLKNGQEFQLEIFNPSTDVIAAEIEMNGEALKGGRLVLKPGERVFLDRYLNVDRKFKFDTYQVGKSKAVENAIRDNGSVSVNFYKRQKSPNTFWVTNIGTNTWNTPYYTHDWGTYNTTNISYSDIVSTFTSTNTANFVDMDSMEFMPTSAAPKLSSKKETGRVEQGGKSEQTFTHVDYQFEPLIFHSVSYKLLPISEKQVTSSDLNVKRYCTECGAKHKPNFKFCPQCGTKV